MIEPLIVDKKRAQVDIITNYLLPLPHTIILYGNTKRLYIQSE